MKTMQDSRLLRPCFILFTVLCLVCAAKAGAGQAGQVAGAPMGAPPAPAQGQMLAQPASICGNQPLCYDTPDFVATVTDFRTSNQNGINIIDVGMRFQNKLN